MCLLAVSVFFVKCLFGSSAHYVFIYLLHQVFTAAGRLSLFSVSRDHSLGVARGLLIAVASLVVEHWLSCSTAWAIFLVQGSNSCSLHWQADF